MFLKKRKSCEKQQGSLSAKQEISTFVSRKKTYKESNLARQKKVCHTKPSSHQYFINTRTTESKKPCNSSRLLSRRRSLLLIFFAHFLRPQYAPFPFFDPLCSGFIAIHKIVRTSSHFVTKDQATFTVRARGEALRDQMWFINQGSPGRNLTVRKKTAGFESDG
jgi:hypothetical protein